MKSKETLGRWPVFSLRQETTAKIQERTGHLPGAPRQMNCALGSLKPGVRVAIMGCIVNGPGEMADADFGYVGSHSTSQSKWLRRWEVAWESEELSIE